MRRAGLIFACLLLGAAPLWAQPEPPASPDEPQPAQGPAAANADPEGEAEPGEAGEDEAKPKRSQHSRGLTKIRSGSYLRRNATQEPTTDLRGEHERRRDYELVRHFERMAELDVIAKVAKGMGDSQLASEVDAVRRAELERFRMAMRYLQLVTRVRLQTGLP